MDTGFIFTPTVEISIDVNPSIELGVNRFDKIISVSSYNNDGQELVDSLDIKYLDYAQAIDQILRNESVNALLSNNEVMTIGVIDPIMRNLPRCSQSLNLTQTRNQTPTAIMQIQMKWSKPMRWAFPMESTGRF